MPTSKAVAELATAYSGTTRLRYPIKRLTTIKIGGMADAVMEVTTNQELVEALRLIRRLKLNYFVIAGGSNLVFSDKGFRGVIIRYTADAMTWGKTQLGVEAGCSLGKIVRSAANRNLGGLDFLANIPGSVGGGVVGNAGCYGKGIGEYVKAVKIFDVKTGRIKTLSSDQLRFAYRDSLCKRKPHWIVMEVILKLVPAKKLAVLRAVEVERLERWQKHPHQPSAGSFFKNPAGMAAWKLIDAAGMRGAQVGGAKISTKHPNFLVNVGGATAKDAERLASQVQAKVRQATKVALEREVRLVDERGVVR